jgi:hypothetical protein
MEWEWCSKVDRDPGSLVLGVAGIDFRVKTRRRRRRTWRSSRLALDPANYDILLLGRPRDYCQALIMDEEESERQPKSGTGTSLPRVGDWREDGVAKIPDPLPLEEMIEK